VPWPNSRRRLLTLRGIHEASGGWISWEYRCVISSQSGGVGRWLWGVARASGGARLARPRSDREPSILGCIREADRPTALSAGTSARIRAASTKDAPVGTRAALQSIRTGNCDGDTNIAFLTSAVGSDARILTGAHAAVRWSVTTTSDHAAGAVLRSDWGLVASADWMVPRNDVLDLARDSDRCIGPTGGRLRRNALQTKARRLLLIRAVGRSVNHARRGAIDTRVAAVRPGVAGIWSCVTSVHQHATVRAGVRAPVPQTLNVATAQASSSHHGGKE